jgi:asparagine synthase (glutamine-hydrolysing)
MCGILGSINFIPDDKAVEKSGSLLQHRGPDSSGMWIDRRDTVFLLHRRLAIQDLSDKGKQPMHHPYNPSIVIVYNGEIYNYLTLRKHLESKQIVFQSDCDTELLLHAYTMWGTDLLHRIEGMFSFAVWDGDRRSCFLARDPVGQKPLFYTTHPDQLFFGSTPQAVRCIDPRPGTLRYEALCYVLTLGYVPSPLAIWENMHSLDPGHYLLWEQDTASEPTAYWQPPEILQESSSEPDDFVSLFTGICREHLLSDVPVGLLLSGGLDSSCLAALLAHDGIKDINTFTLNFVNEVRSEASIAQETARFLGLQNVTADLVQEDVDTLRGHVAATASQPQGYSALLTWYHLSQEVARHFKTVLSADGGDELFGGYRWYVQDGFGLIQLKRFLKSLLKGGAMARKFDAFSRRSPLHAHALKLFPRFLPDEAAMLFEPLGQGFDEDAMLEPLRRYWIKDLPRQNVLQRVDLMTFCSGSICAKTDNMSMAHSLEVRAPFLDRRMVDWALSRPTPAYGEGRGKQIIRRVIAGKVPERVLNQPKQGFSMKGLQTYDFEGLREEIRESAMNRDGMLNTQWMTLFERKTPYWQARLWTLSAVTKWYEHHVAHGGGA